MNTTVKLCSECKHAAMYGASRSDLLCDRPVVCMIEGTKTLHQLCEWERESGDCGLKGKHWEPRPIHWFIRMLRKLW